MKIFVSWSGTTSRELARFLREWLPSVLQDLTVWVSTEDIAKGKRWNEEISIELGNCAFGIVCITPENLSSDWLHFEAGAIARSVPGSREDQRVTPLLLAVEESALSEPLSQFQTTKPTRDDIRRLVNDLNGSSKSPLTQPRLDETFDVWWPKFETKLAELEKALAATGAAPTKARPEREILEDVLMSMRAQERALLRVERRVDSLPSLGTRETRQHDANRATSQIVSALQENGVHVVTADSRSERPHIIVDSKLTPESLKAISAIVIDTGVLAQIQAPDGLMMIFNSDGSSIAVQDG